MVWNEMDLFLTNTQLLSSPDVNWWTGVVCIIVMFLSDSHSDGTHSLQSIHCWTSDGMLHFSKYDEETNSSTSRTSWEWGVLQLISIFGWTVPLRAIGMLNSSSMMFSRLGHLAVESVLVLNKWKYWFIIVHVLWSRFMKMLLQSASWCSERQRRVYSSSKQIICGTIRLPELVDYIYIYAFSRRFYPKRLTIAFRLYIFLSVCVFPGNRTRNLYHWATGTHQLSQYWGVCNMYLSFSNKSIWRKRLISHIWHLQLSHKRPVCLHDRKNSMPTWL